MNWSVNLPMSRGVNWRAIVGALALLGALLILQACGGDGSDGAEPAVGDIRDDPRLEIYDDDQTTEGQTHVPPTVDVPYTTVPPYGGPHDSRPLDCGLYTSAPRFENAVHAMEHGAVVIWYSRRMLSEPQLEELRSIATAQLEDGVYMIYAPYEAMAVPITLTTWGERLPLEDVEPGVIEAYIDEFKHDAPEPTAAGGCRTAS